MEFRAVFDWCTSHWAFCVFVIGMIFEIPSLKLKPFSRLLGAIGRRLNNDVEKRVEAVGKELGQVKTELDQVKTDNEEQIKMVDMNDANFIRTTILNFANSLLQGQRHTQEEYDHIIDMNDRYETYVRKYDIHNGRFAQAYKYILTCYGRCLEKKNFLDSQPTSEE